VEVDTGRALWIRDAVGSLSGILDEAEVEVMQACWRPTIKLEGRAREVGPLLGWTHTKGILLATGHDSWGISNSTASGKVVSELIFDGKALSADISSLDPRPYLGQGITSCQVEEDGDVDPRISLHGQERQRGHKNAKET